MNDIQESSFKYCKVSDDVLGKLKTGLDKRPDLSVDTSSVLRRNGSMWLDVLCLNCNCITPRTIKSVLSSNFECGSCLKLRQLDVLQQSNFTLNERKRLSVEVVCNACLTPLTLPTQQLQVGRQVRCSSCTDERYKEIAESLNFEYISRFTGVTGSNRVRLRCKVDSTVLDAAASAMREGFVVCQTCRDAKYKTALLARNCNFISKHLDRTRSEIKSRITYSNSSGDVFSATCGNILNGSFATDKKGQWYSPHKTYLIHLIYENTNYFKIGTAFNPMRRMKRLKLQGTTSVYTLEEFDNRFEADKLESRLHSEFMAFKLNPVIAKKFTHGKVSVKYKDHPNRTLVGDGIHEWFSGEEVFQTLVARYNLKEKEHESNSNTTNQANHTGY